MQLRHNFPIFTILPPMLLQQLIERYKSARKQQYLDKPGTYRSQYAFIGTGQHSISNLYPLIHYLAVPLKRICTLHKVHAEKMALRFQQCTGTDKLDDILNDKDIKGVFVSASPDHHFNIIQQLLDAGKYVFVEKPPCHTLDKLQKLIGHPNIENCVVGLQRRFSTINRMLSPYSSKTISYSYRYLTGQYPEGDQFAELFIHPIDNIFHLFGDAEQVSVLPSRKNDRTWFLSIVHTNKVTGMLHLSTDHSWKLPGEELLINADGAILEAVYPNRLTLIEKSRALFNLPLEKIVKLPAVKKVLLDNNHFAPTVPNNNIAAQGFLGEIEYFLKITESGSPDPRYHFKRLLPTYEVFEKIKMQEKTY